MNLIKDISDKEIELMENIILKASIFQVDDRIIQKSKAEIELTEAMRELFKYRIAHTKNEKMTGEN